MKDYLQPIGRAWRIFSIIGCTFTAVIFVSLSLLAWTDMIQRRSLDYEGGPLWIGAAVAGVIGIAATFIAWRLVRRRVSANGVTVLPAWFIQLYGVFMLVCLCFVAFYKGTVLFVVEGVLVSLTMILVGRNIARRQKPRT